MKPQDRAKFLEIIVGFAELKGKQLSAPAMELFWNAMQSWSIEDFTSAANQLIRSCEFMPTPKNFEDLLKAGRLTSGEAWAEVLAIARNGGKIHGDPRVEQAVRAVGGFHAISMSNTDATPFLERRFAEHYDSINDAEDVREAVPTLTGPPRLSTSVKGLLKSLSDKVLT